MQTTNLNDIVYQLTVEDLRNVIIDYLERELTKNEINLLEKNIGTHIDWYEALHNAIIQNIKD